MKTFIKTPITMALLGCLCTSFYSGVARADEDEMVAALQNTYSACIGIDEQLADLKKMAGINTIITGVGTGLGAGALVAGVMKAKTDAEIDKILKEWKQYESKYGAPDFSSEEFVNAANKVSFGSVAGDGADNDSDGNGSVDEYKKLREKSKKLGNWRTGLLAANTATNIAGAIIAGKNQTSGELDEAINRCRAAVDQLKRARAQNAFSDMDLTEADTIIASCDYDSVDLSKINKRGKGAMIASIVGATTGAAGTVTSAVANTDKVRNESLENYGITSKEKGLNTASNVLAGTATAASAVATVFNGIQIKAIKDVATVAAQCTEVLQ